MAAKTKEKLVITAPYGKMPPIEILASDIRTVARLGREILNGGLTERAILLLLSDLTGISKGQIQKILKALPALEEYVQNKKL
jgi:hypothetical protein